MINRCSCRRFLAHFWETDEHDIANICPRMTTGSHLLVNLLQLAKASSKHVGTNDYDIAKVCPQRGFWSIAADF